MLEVKNLSLKYGNNIVFENLNLSFDYGQLVLIYGKSGCGKSSLFHIINGIIENASNASYSGDLLINSKSILEESVAKRSSYIGSVLQNPRDQIIFSSVEDELVFPMENIGLDKSEMHDRLRKYREELSFYNTDTNNLSGGEQQKIMTYASLTMDQDIYILDEPLANLDLNQANELLSKLSDLAKKSGKLIIVFEHRLDLVRPYVDFEIDFEKVANLEKTNNESFRNIRNTNDYKSMVFKLEDINYSINKKTILENISFKVNLGEFITIVGDNGAGKTTLLSILSGLNKKYEGKIYSDFSFENKNIISKKNARKLKVATVLQNPDYQLFMSTVLDELSLSTDDIEFRNWLVNRFDLKDLLNRHPLSLSEGQKRKLSIAVMLSMKPDVLILDEPSVGLDINSILQVIDGINEYNNLRIESGNIPLTLISVSHDKTIIDNLSDKIVKL